MISVKRIQLLSIVFLLLSACVMATEPSEESNAYSEEDVSYENKDAGITLSGTLTLPKADTTVPAVILLAGTGLLDRNSWQEGFNHKPFKVIADYLTQRGIAVLRFDKRGAGTSTGSYEGATMNDFAGDVLAGVEYLKTRKEIDPESIGLISRNDEGASIGNLAASKSHAVAFRVMIAGNPTDPCRHTGCKIEFAIKALFCIQRETIAPVVLETIADWVDGYKKLCG